MTVAKFGGTSVATGEAIRRLVRIVNQRPDVRVVVVSALAGVTDLLVSIADAAEAGRLQEAREAAEPVWERHRLLAADLGLPAETASEIDQAARGFGRRLAAMAEARDGRLRRRDEVLATGELLSSQIVAAACRAASGPRTWIRATRWTTSRRPRRGHSQRSAPAR